MSDRVMCVSASFVRPLAEWADVAHAPGGVERAVRSRVWASGLVSCPLPCAQCAHLGEISAVRRILSCPLGVSGLPQSPHERVSGRNPESLSIHISK